MRKKIYVLLTFLALAFVAESFRGYQSPNFNWVYLTFWATDDQRFRASIYEKIGPEFVSQLEKYKREHGFEMPENQQTKLYDKLYSEAETKQALARNQQ